MKQTIDAVYENGVFRPLTPPDVPDGQRVQIVVEPSPANHVDPVELAGQVYDGLSEDEIDEIERIALDRTNFSRNS